MKKFVCHRELLFLWHTECHVISAGQRGKVSSYLSVTYICVCRSISIVEVGGEWRCPEVNFDPFLGGWEMDTPNLI